MTPFPLPADPDFRKEVIQAWLEDIDDRLQMGDHKSAQESWKLANTLLLQLPPGRGAPSLEKELVSKRVKLDNNSSLNT